jgi:MFS family permease
MTTQRREGKSRTVERRAGSPWDPFRHRVYAVVWIATVVSNIGGWMYNAAAGWLMTSLNPDPLMVSLVQVATTLPMFLFALPAGALADIVDKRKFLIATEMTIAAIVLTFAALVWRGLVDPGTLLLFTFLASVAIAFTAPAWPSIVPELVPKEDLAAAVAANSVGINISRAIGPALGGVIIVASGIAAPFWIDGVSNIGVIAALLWWRRPKRAEQRLPAERFTSAIRLGLRHAKYNRHLRATLLRAVAFFLFGCAYWALLPLVARHQIAGGPELYGLLLGTIGASAVAGAFGLPWLEARLGPDRLVAAGTLGTAVALALFGASREPLMAIAASAIAGVSWIAVLASLNVSAQVALPDWVRARGLSLYVVVLFGAMTLGSMFWGEVASRLGLPLAHFLAAASAALAIPLTWRWFVLWGAVVVVRGWLLWPAPVVTRDIENDQGPVLVTIEYHVGLEDREAFLAALERVAEERYRDGAYSWGAFEDTAEEGRFIETFLVESWLEHLHQHERVTNADKVLQEKLYQFVKKPPVVTHLIAAQRRQ